MKTNKHSRTDQYSTMRRSALIEIKIDGASGGNPGLSGAGVVLKINGEIKEYSFPLGMMSNHEAEFTAMIRALEVCANYGYEHGLAFQTDSKLLQEAFEKNYVKNETFKPLLAKINRLKEPFPFCFIKWIPKEHNKHADRLAREAIYRQKTSTTTP